MTLTGLLVKLDRPTCCQNICVIGPGKGPHTGELRCTDCNQHRGWLSQETACWIASVIATFGRPVEPIVVHKTRDSENIVVTAQERQRRIFEINRRIEMGGFELKDFFLSSPPLRDWFREQQRHKIAQLMHRYGLSAHDLKIPELPADNGAVSGMQARAPESKGNDMDMSEFCGSKYLKLADVEGGPITATIAAVKYNEKYDKADLHFDDNSILSLNATNARTLARAYGFESTDWHGKQVRLVRGEFAYNGEAKPGIALEPVTPPTPPEKKKASKPSKKGGGDMDDEIPSDGDEG